MPDALLTVEHLKKYFPVRRGVLARTVAHVKAVDDVSCKSPRGRRWAWSASRAAARPRSAVRCCG